MNRTETAIAEAFEQLLEEKPLNKITVKDIVERCGVNRNTFYYHFPDIPSLLERIVKEWADDVIHNHSKLGSPMDCIRPIASYFMQRKKAVLHTYHSVQRDVFLVYLERMSSYVVTEYVDTVTAELDIQASDRQILIRFYKCALVGVMLDWLNGGMEYDLIAVSSRICDLFSNAGRQAFLRSAAQGKQGKPQQTEK